RQTFAALPPDVRKGCALPARLHRPRGSAPSKGHSPEMIEGTCPVGHSRHRTSGGRAATETPFQTLSNGFDAILVTPYRQLLLSASSIIARRADSGSLDATNASPIRNPL